MQVWVCKLVSKIDVSDKLHEANERFLGSGRFVCLCILSCFVGIHRTRLREEEEEEEEEEHIPYLTLVSLGVHRGSWVSSSVLSFVICGGYYGTVTGYLRVLQLSPASIMPPYFTVILHLSATEET